MYSVVMLMAMSQTPDLASFGGRNRGCLGGHGCGGYVAASCWGGNGCGGGRGGLFRGRGCGGGFGCGGWNACWGGNGCGGGRGGLFHRRNRGCCGGMADCGCVGYTAGCGCAGWVVNNCGCCGAMASSGCWGAPVQTLPQATTPQAMPATSGTTERKEVIINSFPVGAR